MILRRTVVLSCAVDRAFFLFTSRISEWWPAERRHTGDPSSTIVMSPEGRFFERSRAGKEVELGAVLAWEAPRRLVLDWYPGTDADHPTRVEVLFTVRGAATEVEVVHTATAASAELFPLRAGRYEASWELVTAALARRAELDDR